MPQGPNGLKTPDQDSEEHSKEPIKSLSRTTSMLKATDRCQHVLISEASISASVTPQLERMLQACFCLLLIGNTVLCLSGQGPFDCCCVLISKDATCASVMSSA